MHAYLVLLDDHAQVAHLVDTGQLLVLPTECAAEVQEVFQNCVQHTHQFFLNCAARVPDTDPILMRCTSFRQLASKASASSSTQAEGHSTHGSHVMPTCTCSLLEQIPNPGSLYVYEHYLQPFVQHWAVVLKQDVDDGAPCSNLASATMQSKVGLKLLYFLLDNSMWSTAVLLLSSFPQITAEVASTGISISALAGNPADLQQLLADLPRQEPVGLPAQEPPAPAVLEEMRKRSRMYAVLQMPSGSAISQRSNLPSFMSSFASGSDILLQLGALQHALAEQEALQDELGMPQPMQGTLVESQHCGLLGMAQAAQQQEYPRLQYTQLSHARQAVERMLPAGITCDSSSSHGLTLSTVTDQLVSEAAGQDPLPQVYAGYLPLHSSLARRKPVSGTATPATAAAALAAAANLPTEDGTQRQSPDTSASVLGVAPIAVASNDEDPAQSQLDATIPVSSTAAAGPVNCATLQAMSGAAGLRCGQMVLGQVLVAAAAGAVGCAAIDDSETAAAAPGEVEESELTASVRQPTQQPCAAAVAVHAAPLAGSEDSRSKDSDQVCSDVSLPLVPNTNSSQHEIDHFISQQEPEDYGYSFESADIRVEAPATYHSQFKELAWVSLTGFKDRWLEQSYLVFKNHSCGLLDATAAIVCFAELTAATTRSFSPGTDPLAYQKLLSIMQYASCFFFPYLVMHLYRQLYLRYREPLIVFGRVSSGGLLVLVALGILAQPDAWVAAVGKTASLQLQNGFILPCCQQLRMPAAATIAVLHFASDAFMFSMALSPLMSVVYSCFILVCSLLVWLGVDVWCRYVFMHRYLGAVAGSEAAPAASNNMGGPG